MRKVFLDDLPKHHNNVIDWANSIKIKVKFNYNNIEGEIEITDYDKYKQLIKIKFNEKSYEIRTSHFLRCKIGRIIGSVSNEYRYKIGEVIDDVNSGKLEILNYKRTNARKVYSYKCLLCNNIDTIMEINLNKKQGCNVCSGQKTKVGINDVHTVSCEFGKLFWNYNEGYMYMCNSDKKIDFKCQNCNGKIDRKVIGSIYNQYFKMNKMLLCPLCSDGISYPNKLMYSILRQAGVDFETEYSPRWAEVRCHKNQKMNGRKRYDFYSEKFNFVIEMHGAQHYEEIRRSATGRTLTEEKENDSLKEKLYIEHSSGHYISIDSKISELDYLKQNILKSKLTELINLSQIDWIKADTDSQRSFVKDAWDYWNSGMRSTTKIAKLMNLSKPTIIKYLKRGVEVQQCDYDVEKSRGDVTVVRLNLDGEFLGMHESLMKAHRQLGIHYVSISNAINGKYKTAGGFKWMRKSDYEIYIAQQEAQ